MLQLLLLIPLLGSAIILLIPENSKENQSTIKNIALNISLLNFIVSIFLWVQFNSDTSDYQFVYEFTKLSFCDFNIGVDGISLYYVLLTTFITPIALLSNFNNISSEKSIKFFVISFLLLETFQIALFVVLDLFLFYIFFESVLPILFIIIIVYGSGVNRIRSALLFFLYTLAGSLFMLLAILQIYSNLGSTDFTLISLSEISLESQKILWLSLSFSKKDMTNRLIHSSNSTLNYTGPIAYIPNTKVAVVEERGKSRDCKSLVVYLSPTSLGSTLKYKGFTSKLRAMYQIPLHLQSIILGVLLSDGWLYKKKSGKTLFALKQTNFEYLWLVYTKLSPYCRALPHVAKTSINGKKFTCVTFATRVYPCFTEWYYLFYQEGKKVVPLDLYNMLTYEALAHWIMGDGTKVNRGLTLQTQSFTIKECVFIISILIHKFNLKCSIHLTGVKQRKQPTIYISAKSMEKLRPLTLPYMCRSMMYKIGVDSK